MKKVKGVETPRLNTSKQNTSDKMRNKGAPGKFQSMLDTEINKLRRIEK